MANATLVLTPKGAQKLALFRQAVVNGLELGLAREMRGLRQAAAELAPSPAEEAAELSGGVGSGFPSTAGPMGTSEDGRFIKAGSMVPLQEAIAADPIEVTTEGPRIFVGTGSPARINPRTGFFWMTRSRGLQGPTLPFNEALVQTYEFGGAVWTVVPRPENPSGTLEPEPRVFARTVVKTLQPRRMYGRAADLGRATMFPGLLQAVREAAREVGRA